MRAKLVQSQNNQSSLMLEVFGLTFKEDTDIVLSSKM